MKNRPDRILEAVHETARDLHRLGFIDKRKMRKYDALCLAPVHEYDADKVALRHFVWNPTVTMTPGRRARWACVQAAGRPVHMSTGRV
ncbi:hypothetical protein [Vulcaniibacterium tengchongense]|uniref:Uncharacterized protein n=1 Tax=Vulcaniibacterium tengchongense TaxID=1273429 RepID=A0A3N4VSR3_9GAMM|nr:hypothetical protein [Vulcaniibacterium tengchongense]RPE76840.1 hypothetical protein EDC50_2090 [Vulcaniibacterium tengchongense]